MNQYRKIFLLLRVLSFLIISGTILFLILPVYQNLAKPQSDLQISFLLQNKDTYAWLIDHEKIQDSKSGKEQLIFADEQILDQQILESIQHKSIVLERLFDTVNENKNKIEQISAFTGITYSGFSGKSYQDLSSRDEVPQQFIIQYEEQTGDAWSFHGEGMIISSQDSIIVLQKEKDYKGSLMLLTGSGRIPFTGNFEITTGSIETKEGARFQLNLTEKGNEIFAKYGLKNSFPAYYKMRSPLYQLSYFTGNFSAYQPDLPSIHELLPTIMKYKVLYTKQNNEQAYWQWYYPMITQILKDTKSSLELVSDEKVSDSKFYAQNKKIYIYDENKNSKEFFIKGINLGAAMPGKEFTEFPMSKNVYLNWFNEMEDLHVNTVRIYTLFPPVFYEALYEFNKSATDPIYLFQEIWPEEDPLNSDYLNEAYNSSYRTEIKNVVDAIHGNGNIALRQNRAYGLYRFDVSEYLLGYLVGREMEPEEVVATDELNRGYLYQGDYIFSESNASPTESWLAASCDYVLQIEETYKNRPMVGIVSWPTLDPISHDSEWNQTGDKALQYNDKAVVDIDHIAVNSDQVTGFFGAYHIYPNYPDFMNNDSEYAAYKDDEGTFRYGGYLKDFMEQNTKYPAIVAEYGISTSMYTAHISPDGYHHGGLNEEQQADGMIRMTKSIIKEGYSGAIIFEWMDEWTKKTWTTEPYMIPYNRNLFWHNAMDPEQNYGLIKYKSDLSILNELALAYQNKNEEDGVRTIRVGQDASYVYVDIDFKNVVSADQEFSLTISTNSEESGIDYPEFVVYFNKKAKILVNPGYNWLKGHYMARNHDFSEYEELIQLTNQENIDRNGKFTPEKAQNLSDLRKGSFEIPQNQVQVEDHHVTFRLPYGMLGISDPSSLMILSDYTNQIPTTRDEIRVKKSGMIKYMLLDGSDRYMFEQTMMPWTTPDVTSVKKKGFDKIGQFFSEIK